jgi:hypothetical protein
MIEISFFLNYPKPDRNIGAHHFFPYWAPGTTLSSHRLHALGLALEISRDHRMPLIDWWFFLGEIIST